MALFKLSSELIFPPVGFSEPDGLLAYGGDLSPDRLLLAYRSGIFPWFSKDEPVLWWSPDPRFVLYPNKLKVSHSMSKILEKGIFRVSTNQCFAEVMAQCAEIKRKDQHGTWITDEMITAYTQLHKLGFAQSVEVWQNDELVGGLYGIKIGACFFGESMFSKVSNASKAGFITFVRQQAAEGLQLVDCQVHTSHLESLGAEMVPRKQFLEQINALLDV